MKRYVLMLLAALTVVLVTASESEARHRLFRRGHGCGGHHGGCHSTSYHGGCHSGGCGSSYGYSGGCNSGYSSGCNSGYSSGCNTGYSSGGCSTGGCYSGYSQPSGGYYAARPVQGARSIVSRPIRQTVARPIR